MRDASLLRYPRHDGPGGHAPGAWAPRYHIIAEDHPQRGEWWSACGTAFLIASCEDPQGVPERMRCKRRGCRERWPSAERGRAQ